MSEVSLDTFFSKMYPRSAEGGFSPSESPENREVAKANPMGGTGEGFLFQSGPTVTCTAILPGLFGRSS